MNARAGRRVLLSFSLSGGSLGGGSVPVRAGWQGAADADPRGESLPSWSCTCVHLYVMFVWSTGRTCSHDFIILHTRVAWIGGTNGLTDLVNMLAYVSHSNVYICI